MSPSQSCDTCRRRKVKCDQGSPCAKCQSAQLSCTYNDRVKRKTPLRRSTLPLPHLLEQQIHSIASPNDIPFVISPIDPAVVSASPPTESSPTIVLDNGQWQSRQEQPHRSALLSPSLSRTSFLVPPRNLRISSRLLRMHAKLFLRWMFPIWPVIRPEELLDACLEPESLPPKKYCLLLALSAATNIQLKLASNHSLSDLTDDTLSEVYAPYTQDYFLNETIKIRNTLNIAVDPDADTLLTSCFLFSAYANLERHNEAWFYLSQTVSFVISLRLQDKATYSTFRIEDAEIKSRIYWLVFVLERQVLAYSLHLKRPVVLSSTAPKPSLSFPDDPGPIDGFLSIVSIFEAIPQALYNWLCSSQAEFTSDMDSIPICYWKLSKVSLFPEGALQSQPVNLSITQQWLRTYLWQIALRLNLQKPSGSVTRVPLETPISAAKSVMTTITSVSQRSMEVHGIGMERKLFDMGTYILDFLSASPAGVSSSAAVAADSKELLWGIMLSLSKMRGAQASLLSGLLERSQGYLFLGTYQITPTIMPAEHDELPNEYYEPSNQGNAHNPTLVIEGGWG